MEDGDDNELEIIDLTEILEEGENNLDETQEPLYIYHIILDVQVTQ